MSWSERLTSLFTKANEIKEGVAELSEPAAPSSRAGQQQRCRVCRELGHKAPTCKNNPVTLIEGRVRELEEALAAERDRAERHKELREMAEDQVRAYRDRVDELQQEVAGLKQVVADLISRNVGGVYAKPTR